MKEKAYMCGDDILIPKNWFALASSASYI